MISSRIHNAESFGNGVKWRIAACRKRLRVSRCRTAAHLGIDQLAALTDPFPTFRRDAVAVRLEVLPTRANPQPDRNSDFPENVREKAEST